MYYTKMTIANIFKPNDIVSKCTEEIVTVGDLNIPLQLVQWVEC